MTRRALGLVGPWGAAAAVIGFLVYSHGAAAQARQARSSQQNPLELSLIQLIARPDDFDGQYIRVTGFYRHAFEGTAIYLHREDYEHGLRKNGLWTPTFSDAKAFAAHDMTYVLVEGRFSAKRQGHLGLWSGEIHGITRMIPWPPRAAAK